jgi:hypothetical protein
MLAGISRACGKAIAKIFPMSAQVFRQPFNLFNRQPPSIWIKNVFLGVSIPQFLPLSGECDIVELLTDFVKDRHIWLKSA